MSKVHAIYLLNNDSMDEEAILRNLDAFSLDNTNPTDVKVEGHAVRTYSDGHSFYYLLFDNDTAIAFIRTKEIRLVGGRPAYQSDSAAVRPDAVGKALVLKAYQGMLLDRILVSNGTQTMAGHNIFVRLWGTGLYDFYLVNNRHKLVSEVELPEGEKYFQAKTPGIRIYNSWSCLLAVSKANRGDSDWIRARLPKAPDALERNEKPVDAPPEEPNQDQAPPDGQTPPDNTEQPPEAKK